MSLLSCLNRMELAKLDQIQHEVGKWSRENFGRQESKDPDRTYLLTANGPRVSDLALESLAPLMGMGEEIGEWIEATSLHDRTDAIGDVAIYMLDYCSREGIELSWVIRYAADSDRKRTLAGHYFRLLHVTLKRHQGIRGYEDRVKYEADRNSCLKGMADYLTFQALRKTWDEIVKKRDWKANAATGSAECSPVPPACPDCAEECSLPKSVTVTIIDEPNPPEGSEVHTKGKPKWTTAKPSKGSPRKAKQSPPAEDNGDPILMGVRVKQSDKL